MTLYGPLFSLVYDREWAFWAEHLWPFLAAQVTARCPEAKTWLDLCCGGGHLLRRVCEAGFEATGLDLSPDQLQHAQRNAPEAELIAGDARCFDLGQRFDVITCTFDSLNYLTQPSDLARAFTRVAEHLAPGGLFAFDMNSYEGLEDAWHRTSTIRAEHHVVILQTSFSRETALGCARITGFVREGELYHMFDEEHVERGYRAEEVEALLTAQGLTFEKLDGHSLQAPEARSARLLYVCG